MPNNDGTGSKANGCGCGNHAKHEKHESGNCGNHAKHEAGGCCGGKHHTEEAKPAHGHGGCCGGKGHGHAHGGHKCGCH